MLSASLGFQGFPAYIERPLTGIRSTLCAHCTPCSVYSPSTKYRANCRGVRAWSILGDATQRQQCYWSSERLFVGCAGAAEPLANFSTGLSPSPPFSSSMCSIILCLCLVRSLLLLRKYQVLPYLLILHHTFYVYLLLPSPIQMYRHTLCLLTITLSKT